MWQCKAVWQYHHLLTTSESEDINAADILAHKKQRNDKRLTLNLALLSKNARHCSSVGDVDPGVVVSLHSSHHSHHGLGEYSKLTNGLRAAASGAFVC